MVMLLAPVVLRAKLRTGRFRRKGKEDEWNAEWAVGDKEEREKGQRSGESRFRKGNKTQ